MFRRQWLVAVIGLTWIITHATAGRGQTLFQILALTETMAALLLAAGGWRVRKQKHAAANECSKAETAAAAAEPTPLTSALRDSFLLCDHGSNRPMSISARAVRRN